MSSHDALLVQLHYTYRERTSAHLQSLLTQINSLQCTSARQSGVHNGVTETLLVLSGTIQIYYNGKTFNIPVLIWLPKLYPQRPPTCYVNPTRGMRIATNHKHVDKLGMIYLPYLNEWNPATSTLAELIAFMSSVFSEKPPVFTVASVLQPAPASQGPALLPHALPTNHSPSPSPSHRQPQPRSPAAGQRSTVQPSSASSLSCSSLTSTSSLSDSKSSHAPSLSDDLDAKREKQLIANASRATHTTHELAHIQVERERTQLAILKVQQRRLEQKHFEQELKLKELQARARSSSQPAHGATSWWNQASVSLLAIISVYKAVMRNLDVLQHAWTVLCGVYMASTSAVAVYWNHVRGIVGTQSQHTSGWYVLTSELSLNVLLLMFVPLLLIVLMRCVQRRWDT